jgi:hypothetical protein
LTDRRTELSATLTRLEAWGAARGWSGSDPYDGLNATRVVTALKRSRRGRQAITQMVKRSPVNLRPLFGVEPEPSAAALAQVISAYAVGGWLEPAEARRKLERSLQELQRLRSPGFDSACWGYHFDVQTRVFFYPRGAPNTIATAYAGQSLIDAWEATGEQRLLGLAEQAGDFFLREVPATPGREGAFFGYLADDRTPIHNANMLACALLARLAQHLDRADFEEAARAGVTYTAAHQRDDGSWPYGERPGLEWTDGFHTGYVLESLLACDRAGIEESRPPLERGLSFYRERLFLGDGTPKYFDSAVYPVDSQCAAQGIQTFARAGLLEAAWKVFDYAVRELRREDGAFIFQRRRLWRNRTPHVRWAAAPMLLAMAHLYAATEPDSAGEDHARLD